MPATRLLILLTIILYMLLPLPWILWRPVGLFYHFDLEHLPWIAGVVIVFGGGWIIGESLRLRGQLFQVSQPVASSQRWPVSMVAIMAALTCSLIVNTVLYSMDALVIDEISGRKRIPVLTTLGSAHIFALIYSGGLLFCRGSGRHSFLSIFLSLSSVLLTEIVGIIEKRRTAVLLPFIVYAVLAIMNCRPQVLWRFLLTIPLFLALFAFLTYGRSGSRSAGVLEEDNIILAGDMVVGRLGNPLLILDPVLTHLANEPTPFDPHTVQSIFAMLPNLGLIPPPFENGFGNEFGHQLGMLSRGDNEYTGINSGWIGELLLFGGLSGLLLGSLILGFFGSTCWYLIAETHPAGLFLRVMVVIFIVSGFQMEVAFPLVSLLRATVIAFFLAVAERIVRSGLALR